MNRKMLLLVSLLTVTLAGGAVLAQPVAGAVAPAPLADKLPAQSLVYLGWGGVGPNKAALDKTTLGQLVNDPEIRPYVDQMWAQFDGFLKKQGEDNLPPGAFGPIRSLILDVVVDRPWAMSLIDVKVPKPAAGGEGAAGAGRQEPEVSAVLLIDLGNKADETSKNIDAMIDSFVPPEVQKAIQEVDVKGAKLKSFQPDEHSPVFFWGVVNKHLLMTVGKKAAEQVVALLDPKPGEKAAPALSANPQFAKVLAKTGGGMVYFYVDVARFRKDLLPVMLDKITGGMGEDGDKESAMGAKIVTALGVDAVDAVGCGLRTDGADFVRQGFVLAPRGKPGLLVFADQKPLSKDLLAVVPADATFAVLMNENRPKVLAEVRKQLANFPKVKEQYDKQMKMMEDTLGMTMNDLTAAVGDGVAIYNSPSAGGFLFTGETVVAEVKDVAKLRAALPKIEQAVLKQLGSVAEEEQNMGVPVPPGMDREMKAIAKKVSFKSAKFKDYEYRYTVTAGLPMPFAPAWCLTDKYLVFSMFPQTLKAALLKIEAGKKDSLLENDWLGQHLAGQAKGASMICYVNDRQLVRVTYPLLLPLWQVGCSMAAKAGMVLDVNAMPRQDMLIKYMGDSFGAVIPDADGVILTGRSPGPISAMGAAGMVVPLAMYGLLTARMNAMMQMRALPAIPPQLPLPRARSRFPFPTNPRRGFEAEIRAGSFLDPGPVSRPIGAGGAGRSRSPAIDVMPPASRPDSVSATQADFIPATQPVVAIDLSSPKATLETMHRASLAGDVEGYVRTMTPAVQRAVRISTLSFRRLEAKALAVAAVVDLKVGREQGDMVRDLVAPGIALRSPLTRAVRGGRVDWTRVTIDETDDKAMVIVVGQLLPITLSLIDGKWYAVPPAVGQMGPARFEAEITKAAAINSRFVENLAVLGQRVESGAVSPENFQRVFNATVFGVGGPPPK